MNLETLKVLVVTDVAADAAQIARLLADHFEHIETSTIESRFIADFERVQPDVVVLAFTSLERAERYSLGLYRHSEVVHSLPHRSIVLCDKDNVHRAFELCRKEYFDDYVLYWPMVFDTPRLAMSVLIAGRSLQAQRDTPNAREVAAHARSISQLETVLDDRIEVGRQHADALERALQAAEIEASSAQPRPAAPAAPSSDSATIPDAGLDVLPAFTDSFELDVGDVPSGLDRPTQFAVTPQEDVIQEAKLRVDEAKKKVVPLTEWIGGLKADVKPQLDAARQLGELAGRTPPLIVVVDDDAFQCKLLERLLGNSGYRSIIAHSGAEALAVLGRQPPDLILMDVALPDFNGVELTRRLKAIPRFAAIPVVMITGHSERQVLEASLKAGAVDFLVKPFDREILLQKLARHLAP
ncbi:MULTISPECIES: response regulator [Thauera]|uniref:Response regulator n=2 Tax=Thauera aminoaromatica TaxID=164330 RepID=C4ZM56_THASP|nr:MULTISPECIES: response regulator [Thauera]TMW74270.1 response regulator [Thauera sp. UPWRP]ACK54111.1 response regulator receiver protein [Thauera aminoaromatica]ENO86322.1 response regulator receiver protein [Thauera aminoaromatica S2]KIN91321.1 response regulator [Thauera sp. SWB20]MBP6132599.1 response regulator [Thauera sp.]